MKFKTHHSTAFSEAFFSLTLILEIFFSKIDVKEKSDYEEAVE